jgi:hypothetical protein
MTRFLTLKTLWVPAVLALALAAFAMGQGSASAHSDYVYHGDDWAGVSPDHTHGAVFDYERDGHYVCGEWKTNGDDRIYKACDGGDSGADYIGPFDFPVDKFRVCEENKGCSSWQST